jgi:hypothetical protein
MPLFAASARFRHGHEQTLFGHCWFGAQPLPQPPQLASSEEQIRVQPAIICSYLRHLLCVMLADRAVAYWSWLQRTGVRLARPEIAATSGAPMFVGTGGITDFSASAAALDIALPVDRQLTPLSAVPPGCHAEAWCWPREMDPVWPRETDPLWLGAQSRTSRRSLSMDSRPDSNLGLSGD